MYAVVSALAFSFLLYLASVNLRWFTPTRGLLVPVGLLVGLILALLEVRIVTRSLSQKEQTVVWQVLAASALAIGLPLLLAKILLNGSEFLPFAGYLFLPSVPAFCLLSGWMFRTFEQEHKVQVKVLSFGYLYHKEPIVVDADRLSLFMELVALRDGPGLWQQIGYVKKLRVALQSQQDIEPSKKEQLLKTLKVMARYRRIALIALASIIVVGFGVLVVSCSQVLGGPILLSSSTIDVFMPLLGGYFLALVAGVFLMLRMFNSGIRRI